MELSADTGVQEELALGGTWALGCRRQSLVRETGEVWLKIGVRVALWASLEGTAV